jgi:cellobiose phosphorylase
VGHEGRGESVWLGWFLSKILHDFAAVVEAYGDTARAARWRGERERMATMLEQAWDGDWYRRAYFDDGTPLGSSANAECQIDSIAQSWSVLSQAGAPERSRLAMDALDRRLVRRDHALVQLLHPPFDKSDLNPGYIRGYVPRGRGNCSACSIHCATASRRRGPPYTRWSPTSWQPMCMQSHRIPAAAAGPGTPVPPAGCTG